MPCGGGERPSFTPAEIDPRRSTWGTALATPAVDSKCDGRDEDDMFESAIARRAPVCRTPTDWVVGKKRL